MADGFLRLPPDSIGKSVRTVVNGEGAHQEVVVLARPDGTLVSPAADLSDYEVRIEYGARPDGNPERVGKAPNGTAVTSPVWNI